jgi:hypothetical protein
MKNVNINKNTDKRNTKDKMGLASSITSSIASLLNWILGYSMDPSMYALFDRQHIVLYPHTTKMEAVAAFLLLISTGYRRRICFPVTEDFMKYRAIRIPMEYVGGFSLKENNQSTQTIVQYLKDHPEKSLFISPEGTLLPRPWRRGFYYIAQQTKSPIAIAGMDFRTHTMTTDPHHRGNPLYVRDDHSYEEIEKEAQRRFRQSGICPKHPLCSFPIIDGTQQRVPSYIPARRMYWIGVAQLVLSVWCFAEGVRRLYRE